MAAGRVPMTGDAFFLVDPLDGTRAFIKGSPGVHHQHRAYRRSQAGVRHHLCAGAGSVLRNARTARIRRSDRSRSTPKASHLDNCALTRLATRAARSAGARCFRQPLARIADHRRIPAAAADRGEAQGELVAEVLSDRARRSRPLRASRADERVGHRCRPSDSRGRRRQRDDARRAAADSTARGTPATPTRISSPGRGSRCCAPRDAAGAAIRSQRGGPNGHTFATLCAEGF